MFRLSVAYISIVFLLLCVQAGTAQNEDKQWRFGLNAGLDFMAGPPTIVLNSAMNTISGSSSIADASGNLLFYTNGNTVWNKTNAVMANGTGLVNAIVGYQQLPLIIKQPGNSNIYFIITYSGTVSGNVLCYSMVDMSLAAGLGSVTAQNVVFAPGGSVIAATRHCNGRDVWLIVLSATSQLTSDFHVFAITASGISASPVVSPALQSPSISEGVVSPDGKKLALIRNGEPSYATFDNNTGLVSNLFILSGPLNYACYGAAFSPDATKLYACRSGNYIMQWDVCAGSNAAIYASHDSVLCSHSIEDMKLATDGKIYLLHQNQNSLDVINAPNQALPSINLVSGAQSLVPNSGVSHLPNFENGFSHSAPQTPPFTYTVNNSLGCQTASFTATPVVQNYTTIGCSVVGYSLISLAWNFGDPNSGAANTSNLASTGHHFSALGTYTVQLILYYSCGGANDTLSQVVQVNQPCMTVANTGILCSSLGSATVTSLIGTGPFSYTWIPSGQSGSVATGLSPGSYTVLIHDATNNTYTATTTFTPPAPMTGTLSSSGSVPCYGAATGTANIITSGGSGTAHYSWSNGVSSFTVASPVGLTAGSWTVTVTDALTSCVADSVFLITQPPSLGIGVSPGSASICVGSGLLLNGNSSGIAGILYSWQPTIGLSSGNALTVTASPVATTIYTLTGTLNGCSESVRDTVHVVPPPNLNVSLSSATTCAEALNGSANTITLTAGGAATYTINTPNDISNSNPNGPITNLNALPPHLSGISTATVYGSNGVCTVSGTAVFTIVPNPTVSISNPTPVICAGQSYTYTGAGADSYTWSSSTPGQTVYTTGNISVFNSTTSAVFSVYGGSLGCNSVMQSSTITVNPLPSLSVNPNPVITCIGTPVLLNALGTATQYNWFPSQGLSADHGATVYANPPAQQVYTVVASLNSCTSSATATVSLLPLPVPAITTATQGVCMNGSIALHGEGGASYSWNGPAHVNAQGQNIIFQAGSTDYSGIYTLTVHDQNNCSASATQSITVFRLPDGYFDAAAMQGCAPFHASLSFHPASYSSSVTSLSWSVDNRIFSGNTFSYLFTNAGNYVVSGFLTDLNHCANSVTAMVTVYPKPHADFSFAPEHPVENFDAVQFDNQSKDAVTFSWEFGKSDRSEIQYPSYLFENAGTYPVALIVNSQWNCKDTLVKLITVEDDFAVYLPNTFTPNEDGKNDAFFPVMRGVKLFNFSIFDRWGEEIFSTTDTHSGWNGTYKGESCKEDVYVWKLEVTGKNNQNKKQSGFVTLYR